MPLKRRNGPQRGRTISEADEAWLRGDDSNPDTRYFYSEEEKATLIELWSERQEAIVAEHVLGYPGFRPKRWWQYSAPEPRRRLGGIGTPASEKLANAPRLYLGVPLDWIVHELVASYAKIGSPLDVPALDLVDPPLFESQAAYLRRLKLLLPGEQRRLRLADFEPEPITEILNFGDTQA